MSTDKPAKKPRSTKTKANLEAKIAELEAKLNALAVQASKPAETRPSPPPAPSPAPEPEPERAEPEPQKQKEEPRRIEPPTPTVKYTGDNYYRTRRGLAYHPPDKRFRVVAVKFEEPPTVTQVEPTSSSQSQSTSSSSQKRSRDEELAEYEKEYLERLQQRKAEAEKPAPAPTKPRGTMPAGWKPS